MKGFKLACTASNSNRSTPTCSPVLRHRSRSPTPQQSLEPSGENMVEKGHSDPSSDKDKSPSTIEQVVQRTYSQSVHSTTRSHGGKNSKSHKRLSKKSQSWYNVLSPTYKQRNEDFRKLFKQLPDSERLIVDYSCALQRDILLQGRLYVSENWICFYSNIFRWETLLTVRLKDICSMTKEKTARLIPNAIQLCTDNDKHFFTSFGARDRTYMMMFKTMADALLEKSLSLSPALVLLVFLNMMLFYKLWMLEYTTQSLTSWHGLRPQESKLPQTQLEWAQLLESQQRYHDDELQKWKEIIKSSVMLLDEMKDSLLNLQKGMALRDYNSESEEKRSRYH
ncbi:protein Aster-B-like [Oncorhynchus kisutch]|uniref:protein Aster-B-like n=1 Tax=Oncorhynchus kisutch TaxID=8019 RepID=UPI0012DDD2B0|nr:protein Aster-B-like [Oncorhynchus kisutch]